MPAELALDQMTISEKLHLMERLWDDLARSPDDIPSPVWHKEVLEECRRKAESGEERLTDWETAKADIRRQVE
jgi:hypothetical protein